MNALVVRDAIPEDATAIAMVLAHLGYPTTAAEVEGRLQRLRQSEGAIALVAVAGDAVIGVITGHLFAAIHSTPPVAWITALSIHEQHQRSGAGRALVERVEHWARARGATKIAVTSALHRDGAHAFYERLGWQRTGVRLGKNLG